MSFFTDPPLHDFPDRAIRRLQAHPAHLRELVQAVVPDLAPRFDFDRTQSLERDFPLPDWRRRETDLLFHVPFRVIENVLAALVCVLVEHQSAPDPTMPLRTLLYAVLFWEREWRAWVARHARGEPLRLSPVLPIILHTGPDPWATNRKLVDLMAGPDQLRAFIPDWQPLFWDLASHSPEELLHAAGEWLPTLAVVRAEQADAKDFHAIYAEVTRKLEPLGSRDRMRWSELLWFLLSWGRRRRPGAEWQQLHDITRDSHKQVALQKEIEEMAQSVAQTWEQEILARGEARGRLEGRLEERRDELLALLAERFGALPETVVQRINSTTDLEKLRACVRQTGQLRNLDELNF
jgi:hypothetical protein